MKAPQIPKFLNLFENETTYDFKQWKIRRNRLISLSGSHFITCSESDLITIFSKWESDLKNPIFSDSTNYQMTSLLVISILNYFRRNYEQFNRHFSITQALSASQNRDVCRAASKVVNWAVKESNDNKVFLRQQIDLVHSWFHPSSRQKFLFNSLTVLNSVGDFLPNDVFNVTMKYFFPEIWDSVCSSDNELRKVALKIVRIHLQCLPTHTSEYFAESFYKDCCTFIIKKSGPLEGAILSCQTIFQLYPNTLKFPSIIEILAHVLVDASHELSLTTLSFICELIEQKREVFTPSLIKRIIAHLRMIILNSTTSDVFLTIAIRIINILELDMSLIVQMVDTISDVLQNTTYDAHRNTTYLLLSAILDKYPNFHVESSFFKSDEPCPGMIQALSKQRHLLEGLKFTLTGWFAKTNQKKNASEAIMCLQMVKEFGSSLFETIEALFEMVKHYSFNNNENVRISFTKTLPVFRIPEAETTLFRMALYDSSKKVRFSALQQIKYTEFGANSEVFIQFLSDPSFKVRNAALPMISQAAKKIPFSMIPPIITFMNDFLLSNICSPDPKRSAKSSSLLPYIAQNFVCFNTSIIPLIGWICVRLLLHGEEFPAPGVYSKNGSRSRKSSSALAQMKASNYKLLDLRQAIHKDFVNNGFFGYSCLCRHSDSPCHDLIIQIVNEKWHLMRDKYLLQTLGILSSSLMPYILQIVPVFIHCFEEKHSEDVCLAAIEALRLTILSFESKVKFTSLFPDLFPVLLKELSSNSSTKVAVSILQLTATAGASYFYEQCEKSENNFEFLLLYRTSSFFVDFVMESLISLLTIFSMPLFEVVTNIICQETQYTLKYLDPIISIFSEALQNSSDDMKKNLLQELEIIAISCTQHIVPHVHYLVPYLKANLSSLECILLCSTLSYELKSEFTPFASNLYPAAFIFLNIEDNDQYIKALVKFLCLCIIYQHQSIDAFLDFSQPFLIPIADIFPYKQRKLLKGLSILCQYADITAYTSRIAQICFLYFPKQFCNPVPELVLNLCLHGRLSKSVVDQNLKFYGLSFPQLNEINNKEKSTSSYYNSRKPIIDNTRHGKFLNNKALYNDAFKNIPNPSFNNSKKWLDDLCVHFVSFSPSVAIQSCSVLVTQSQSFKRTIFPIAFLSCWKEANKEEKIQFSNVVKMILLSYDSIDPTIFQLVEVLDKCGSPLEINDDILANASPSSGLSLYFLERYYRSNPGKPEAVENLLRLNSKMGRIESARGLLTSARKVIDQCEAGRWSEQLGEWEKALEIYEAHGKKNLSGILRCHAHLEQWDLIRAHSQDFERLSSEEQRQNAIWFAWAFYHSHNLEMTSYYVERMGNKEDHNILLFRAIFLIASKQYANAEIHIQHCFLKLAENRAIYGGNDANQASKNFIMAQHLIELQEILQIKKETTLSVPKLWQQRLHVFSNDSDAWTKLIEIRNLLLSPSEHVQSCLKLISVLRKERKWRLVDAYFSRLDQVLGQPRFVIARLKVLWARGDKVNAINQITLFNKLLCADSAETIRLALESTSLEGIKFFSALLPKDSELNPEKVLQSFHNYVSYYSIGDNFRSKCIRIQAAWQYQLYKAKTSSTSMLTDIIESFKYSNSLKRDDYRTWSGWAYACSRALSHRQDLRSAFAADAISGFLRATQLRPSDSLEFLCQMFSIFFRYGESIDLPASISREIVSLSPQIVIQIIPQIVVHIAHPVLKVRQLVQDLISTFSNFHFEAIVYPLHLLSLLSDKAKASIARDLLRELGGKQPEIYTDAMLLINGMYKAAVSLYENWATTLDSATRIFHQDSIKSVEMLSNLFSNLDNAVCEQDRQFYKTFHNSIQRAKVLFDKYRGGDNSVLKTLWDGFRSLFVDIEDKMKKIDIIQLNKVSTELSSKRGYKISVPGAYSVDGEYPLLYSIGESLQVFSTQQHPRTVNMNDNQGKSWKFLLKGNEDLRLDQRIMMFFQLVNSLIKTNRLTSKLGVSLIQYAIIPFAPNAGLISWVTGADTFQQLVSDYRNQRDIPQLVENEICSRYVHEFNFLNSLQRIEIYDHIKEETKGLELREMIWIRSPSTSEWLEHSYNFTISTALMSMTGYVIGLGDRHPSNIMIQRHTGRVIHIDFGDSFESTQKRTMFPELVPFRLTRMIVNALDTSSVEGLFRKSCEDALYVLREHQGPLIAQLEIFVHEPIFCPKESSAGVQPQREILTRVATKLNGTDNPENEEEREMDANEQVDALIRTAADELRYIRHYIGWCPFW